MKTMRSILCFLFRFKDLCFAGLFFSVLGLFVPSAPAADNNNLAYIDILVGSLQDPSELQIVKNSIDPLLASKPDWLPANVEFRYLNTSAKSSDLISSLRNPSVLGVIWIGHPALTLVGDPKNPEIINSFIKGSDGRYLPKNILSAAHANLKFFGLVICHSPDVSPRYQLALPSTAEYFAPKGIDFTVTEGADNPAFILTSLFLGPRELLGLIGPKLGAYAASFPAVKSETAHKQRKLSIKYSDLLSKSFDYSVLVNKKIVGTLRAGNAFTSTATFETKLDEAELGSGSTIEIAADDPLRKTANPGPMVDDILLLDVTVTNADGISLHPTIEGSTSLEFPIHLGDENITPDRSTGLFDTRNDAQFEKSGAAQLCVKLVIP